MSGVSKISDFVKPIMGQSAQVIIIIIIIIIIVIIIIIIIAIINLLKVYSKK